MRRDVIAIYEERFENIMGGTFFRRLLCRKALICSPNLRLSCSDGEVNTEGIAGFLWETARPERKIH